MSNPKKETHETTWTPNNEIAWTQGTGETLSDFEKTWSDKNRNARYQKITDVRSQKGETKETWIPYIGIAQTQGIRKTLYALKINDIAKNGMSNLRNLHRSNLTYEGDTTEKY